MVGGCELTSEKHSRAALWPKKDGLPIQTNLAFTELQRRLPGFVLHGLLGKMSGFMSEDLPVESVD